MATEQRPVSRPLIRLAWFIGIWAASVAAWGAIAFLLHKIMRA